MVNKLYKQGRETVFVSSIKDRSKVLSHALVLLDLFLKIRITRDSAAFYDPLTEIHCLRTSCAAALYILTSIHWTQHTQRASINYGLGVFQDVLMNLLLTISLKPTIITQFGVVTHHANGRFKQFIMTQI